MIKNVFDVNVRGQPSPVTVDINRFFAWIIAGPVSYTHLDVYKRQVNDSCFTVSVFPIPGSP